MNPDNTNNSSKPEVTTGSLIGAVVVSTLLMALAVFLGIYFSKKFLA